MRDGSDRLIRPAAITGDRGHGLWAVPVWGPGPGPEPGPEPVQDGIAAAARAPHGIAAAVEAPAPEGDRRLAQVACNHNLAGVSGAGEVNIRCPGSVPAGNCNPVRSGSASSGVAPYRMCRCRVGAMRHTRWPDAGIAAAPRRWRCRWPALRRAGSVHHHCQRGVPVAESSLASRATQRCADWPRPVARAAVA